MKKVMLFAILAALLLAPCAFAEDSVWESAKSDQYGKKAGGMLGRGLVNAATCFVDLIVQTVHGTQDGPPFVGTLTGLGAGLGCTALRATSGVLDIVTFWVPGFNGMPVSRSYSNCLEEEVEGPATAAQSAAVPAAVSSEPVVAAPVVAARPAPRRHDPDEYVKK